MTANRDWDGAGVYTADNCSESRVLNACFDHEERGVPILLSGIGMEVCENRD